MPVEPSGRRVREGPVVADRDRAVRRWGTDLDGVGNALDGVVLEYARCVPVERSLEIGSVEVVGVGDDRAGGGDRDVNGGLVDHLLVLIERVRERVGADEPLIGGVLELSVEPHRHDGAVRRVGEVVNAVARSVARDIVHTESCSVLDDEDLVHGGRVIVVDGGGLARRGDSDCAVCGGEVGGAGVVGGGVGVGVNGVDVDVIDGDVGVDGGLVVLAAGGVVLVSGVSWVGWSCSAGARWSSGDPGLSWSVAGRADPSRSSPTRR